MLECMWCVRAGAHLLLPVASPLAAAPPPHRAAHPRFWQLITAIHILVLPLPLPLPAAGNGLNAALEDAAVLAQLLDRHGADLAAVPPAFTAARLADSEAILWLDGTASARGGSTALGRLHPHALTQGCAMIARSLLGAATGHDPGQASGTVAIALQPQTGILPRDRRGLKSVRPRRPFVDFFLAEIPSGGEGAPCAPRGRNAPCPALKQQRPGPASGACILPLCCVRPPLRSQHGYSGQRAIISACRTITSACFMDAMSTSLPL